MRRGGRAQPAETRRFLTRELSGTRQIRLHGGLEKQGFPDKIVFTIMKHLLGLAWPSESWGRMSGKPCRGGWGACLLACISALEMLCVHALCLEKWVSGCLLGEQPLSFAWQCCLLPFAGEEANSFASKRSWGTG